MSRKDICNLTLNLNGGLSLLHREALLIRRRADIVLITCLIGLKNVTTSQECNERVWFSVRNGRNERAGQLVCEPGEA